jgi:hypothetical protein
VGRAVGVGHVGLATRRDAFAPGAAHQHRREDPRKQRRRGSRAGWGQEAGARVAGRVRRLGHGGQGGERLSDPSLQRHSLALGHALDVHHQVAGLDLLHVAFARVGAGPHQALRVGDLERREQVDLGVLDVHRPLVAHRFPVQVTAPHHAGQRVVDAVAAGPADGGGGVADLDEEVRLSAPDLGADLRLIGRVGRLHLDVCGLGQVGDEPEDAVLAELVAEVPVDDLDDSPGAVAARHLGAGPVVDHALRVAGEHARGRGRPRQQAAACQRHRAHHPPSPRLHRR